MNNYAEKIRESVRDCLSEMYEDVSVEIEPVLKNNGVESIGLGVCLPETHISIPIDPFLEKIRQGRFEDTIHDIVNQIIVSQKTKVWDYAKKNIAGVLVNKKLNGPMLEKRPHMDINEDLAIVFNIKTSNQGGCLGTLKVYNEMLSCWNVTVEDLYACFLESNKNNSVLLDMVDMLPPWVAQESGVMYVLTNKEFVNGAAMVLLPEMQEMIKEKIGEDITLIPSSVHEMIVLSNEKFKDMDTEYITSMIGCVNNTDVSPEEVLANQPFTLKNGKLTTVA